MAEPRLSAEETGDLRWVMSNPEGRRFVRRMMVATGMYKSVFRMRPNVAPEERLAVNGAQQDFGHRIQSDLLEADPVNFLLMNSEAVARKQMEKGQGKIEVMEDENDEENGE